MKKFSNLLDLFAGKDEGEEVSINEALAAYVKDMEEE